MPIKATLTMTGLLGLPATTVVIDGAADRPQPITGAAVKPGTLRGSAKRPSAITATMTNDPRVIQR